MKVIADVLMGCELEMPRPLSIVLRGIHLDGAVYPIYSITGHCFAMNNGTDGEVSLLDGFYQATVSDNIFESDYIRIEGIADGDQPAWLIRISDTFAVDPAGNDYILQNDGNWVPAEMDPVMAEEAETARAN